MPPSAEAVQAVNDILHPKPDAVGYLGIPDGAGGYLYDMPFRPGSIYARVQLGIEFEIAEVRAGGIARDPDLKLNFFGKNGILTAENPNADGAVARFGEDAGRAYVAPHALSDHNPATANLDFGGFAVLNGGAATFNASQGDKDFTVRGLTDAGLLFMDASTDQVGIGTTSPGTKLDVRGGVTINENGDDADVRIESDGDSANFFSDGGTNRIGIGTNSPNTKLDVRGGMTVNDDAGNFNFRVEGNADQNLIVTDAIKNSAGVGTNSGIEDTAKFQIESTTKGFLCPRMTTTQRDAISSPATGLLIYNTTTNFFNWYDGAAWQELSSGGAATAGMLYVDDTGVDVVNTTTETDLYSGSGTGSVTLPANFATPSVVIDGEIGAYFSTPGLVNSRFRLYIGSTVVLDFAFTVVSSVADFMRIRWNFFAKGSISAADYSAYAEVLVPVGWAITTPYYFQNGASPVDLSIPNIVQFTIEWGAADPLAEIISTPGAFIAYRST